jgi:hypothetical protein
MFRPMNAALSFWDRIAALAPHIEVTAEALRKARERGRVPHRWRLRLLDEAKRRDVPLRPDEFDAPPDRPSHRRRRRAP